MTSLPIQGGGEKCDICSKTVYAAERIEAGKRPFHKFCFKCSECKMQLKLENYAQADGILYCKKHYASCVVAKNTQDPAAAM
ncbi:PLI2B-like protein [Mya arenaria]|uniref:PLI2B-like protein n=1 Tax=Mya arenaria TaxID=6604 RepID=A0ABY7GB57_MYAAR|nr:PLI2B-like protein [Mya arenaria]